MGSGDVSSRAMALAWWDMTNLGMTAFNKGLLYHGRHGQKVVFESSYASCCALGDFLGVLPTVGKVVPTCVS